MSELVFLKEKEVVTDSLTIAKMFGKEHKNVLADIRKQADYAGEEFGRLNFQPSSYKNSQNKEMTKLDLTEEAFTLVVFSYNTKEAVQTKIKFIQEFKRMKEYIRNEQSFKLPGTYKEALLQLVEQVERNEQLETKNLVLSQQNNELKPKACYYDMVLQNKSLLSVSKIAKDYGMSARALNKKLHQLGVQYKQGDIWLLYAKFQDKGYSQTTTHVIDADRSRVSTKWTQKGRLFIYDLLKSNGILPVIDREEVDAS